MLCRNTPQANDLILCADDDARLWIGISALSGLSAIVTDLATGRKLYLNALEDADEWYIVMPELVVGHMYLFQLGIGVNPVEFYPYVMGGYSITSGTEKVDGVNATVLKFYEPTGETYYTSNDQFLVVP